MEGGRGHKIDIAGVYRASPCAQYPPKRAEKYTDITHDGTATGETLRVRERPRLLGRFFIHRVKKE